jgi:hypothetical protein
LTLLNLAFSFYLQLCIINWAALPGRTSNEFPHSSKPFTLPASLKDDTARMNDRNKHKVTGQMNRQKADTKANASVFLFFPTAHFLKTILTSRTNGTFGFARHASQRSSKPKEPFFANALLHSQSNS